MSVRKGGREGGRDQGRDSLVPNTQSKKRIAHMKVVLSRKPCPSDN